MELIKDYIDRQYKGSINAFCAHNGMLRYKVTRWINKGWWCGKDEKGVFRAFSPFQRLVDANDTPAPVSYMAFKLTCKETGEYLATVSADYCYNASAFYAEKHGITRHNYKIGTRRQPHLDGVAQKTGLGFIVLGEIHEPC